MRDLSLTLCRYDGDVLMKVDGDTFDVGATTNYGLPAGEHY